jgi:tetratricopeptide (TPR) repeat protein
MKFPDRQALSLAPGALLESVDGEDRIVVWFPRDRNWERIASVARGDVAVEQGLCSVPAYSILAEPLRGVRALKARFQLGQGERTWILPTGANVRQVGERRTGLMLVWGENPGSPPAAESVRTRWPGNAQVDALGANLFLVSGAEPRVAVPDVPMEEDPRVLAEQALIKARVGGDPRALAFALGDLGAVFMVMKAPNQARPLLEEALAIHRQRGDSVGEADALLGLGLAALELGDLMRARDLYAQSYECARNAGSRFATKLALEQAGLLYVRAGDAARASACFEEAITLAHALGDNKHEGQLRWYLAILHAESGRREPALAQARGAIALLERSGDPAAACYADHLRSYETGAAVLASTGQEPGAAAAPTVSPPNDVRWLRQALSAAKALVKFVGSGGQVVGPEVRRRRLEVCDACEHHTGVRCRLCGCYTRVKTRLPYEACPIGKWPAEARAGKPRAE